MATARKYEGFPDIDASAPDVYETPELADDISTLQETSAQSPSEGEEDEGGISEAGIDKRRLKSNQARSRFQPSRVNADDVDFSDRLTFNPRSYRTISSRRRPGQYDYDPEELGDFSDEDDEPLDRKLARLRREVEQIRSGLEEEKQTQPEESSKPAQEDDPFSNIEKISETLDSIHTARRGGAKGAEADFQRTLKLFSTAGQTEAAESRLDSRNQSGANREISADPQLMQSISKIADFDSRLQLLENSLGLTGSNMPESGEDSPRLILPTLDSLEQMIGTATAQPSQLESAQLKTRQLLKDAERLSRLRAETNEPRSQGAAMTNGHDGDRPDETPEQTSRVNALYGLLPTIDSLSPTLPPLLERLRTLRLLHSSAANANTMLDELEKRQNEQAGEIKQWREALDQVEGNVKEGENTLAENMEKMGGWVRNLEERSRED